MSVSPLSISGIASGLNTNAIIQQLIAVDSQPMQAMQQKIATDQANNQTFQSIQTFTTGLQQSAFTLTEDSTVKAMAATSSNASTATVTAGSGAAAGTYQVTVNQLATATSATSWGAIGQPITDPTTLLSAANTTDPITAGNFTLSLGQSNGTVTPISVAVNSGDSWQNVFDRINTATSGQVTASLSGNKVVLATAAGVTSLQFGLQDDTSNFLHETHLDTSALNTQTSTATSTQPVGVAQADATLQNAKLATALTASTGDFKINGVDVAWDSSSDTIGTILNKINTAGAGVIASYSATNDKLVVTSKNTGSKNIDFQDVNGNLLQALCVDKATQITGQNASITVAGLNVDPTTNQPQPIFSTSNDFTNVIPDVTITAKQAGSSTTLSVSHDTATLEKAIKDFVNQFNGTIDNINGAIAKGQPLAFNADLMNLEDHLYDMVGTPVAGLSSSPSSLMDLGISTSDADKIHLSFDSTKLEAALASNPDQVAAVFQQTAPNASDPTNPIPQGIMAMFNQYLFSADGTDGIFKIQQDTTDSEVASLNDQIKQQQDKLTNEQTNLQKQFTAMEIAISKLKSQQGSMASQLGLTSASTTF